MRIGFVGKTQRRQPRARGRHLEYDAVTPCWKLGAQKIGASIPRRDGAPGSIGLGIFDEPERGRTKVQCRNLLRELSNPRSKVFMKNRKNYVARTTATLTQSGLLAALLQHQRRKVIELTQRRVQREQARGLIRNGLTWSLAWYHGMTASRLPRRGFERGTIPRHT